MAFKTEKRDGDLTAFKVGEMSKISPQKKAKNSRDEADGTGNGFDPSRLSHTMQQKHAPSSPSKLLPPRSAASKAAQSLSTSMKLTKENFYFPAAANAYFEQCRARKVPFFFSPQTSVGPDGLRSIVSVAQFSGLSKKEKRTLSPDLFYLDGQSDTVEKVFPLDGNIDPTTEIHHSFFSDFVNLPSDSLDQRFKFFNRALSSEAFRLGLGVNRSKEIASKILQQIPESMWNSAFTDVLTVALSAKNEDMLRQCLAKGASVTAIDDEGGFLIWQASQPGNERFLKLMLTAEVSKEDIDIIRGALQYAMDLDWPEARDILHHYLEGRGSADK